MTNEKWVARSPKIDEAGGKAGQRSDGFFLRQQDRPLFPSRFKSPVTRP